MTDEGKSEGQDTSTGKDNRDIKRVLNHFPSTCKSLFQGLLNRIFKLHPIPLLIDIFYGIYSGNCKGFYEPLCTIQVMRKITLGQSIF